MAEVKLAALQVPTQALLRQLFFYLPKVDESLLHQIIMPRRVGAHVRNDPAKQLLSLGLFKEHSVLPVLLI